jgi:hypothetical protein
MVVVMKKVGCVTGHVDLIITLPKFEARTA